MTDRAKSIVELDPANSAFANNLLVIENSVGTQKITLEALFSNNDVDIYIQSANTPANSSITVKKGKVFTDGTYLYLATANNVLKRVTLSAF